jgi:hypothetical protein
MSRWYGHKGRESLSKFVFLWFALNFDVGPTNSRLAQNEVAMSSGAYSYGFVRATQILPGDYFDLVVNKSG